MRELPRNRETDSPTDNYVCTHLHKDALADKNAGGRSHTPDPKGRRGPLKLMSQTSLPNCTGVPSLF